MKRMWLFVVVMAAAGYLAVQADQKTASSSIPSATSGHIMILPDAVVWGPTPPGLPAGAEAAVLEGDPSKAGLFTIRAKFPAGYKVPAHWHPADEHVTVLAGTLSMGLGDKFDEKALHVLPVGGYAVMPTGVKHFAYSKDGATIQIHGMGPWGITYVNPKDDPRPRTTQ